MLSCVLLEHFFGKLNIDICDCILGINIDNGIHNGSWSKQWLVEALADRYASWLICAGHMG